MISIFSSESWINYPSFYYHKSHKMWKLGSQNLRQSFAKSWKTMFFANCSKTGLRIKKVISQGPPKMPFYMLSDFSSKFFWYLSTSKMPLKKQLNWAAIGQNSHLFYKTNFFQTFHRWPRMVDKIFILQTFSSISDCLGAIGPKLPILAHFANFLARTEIDRKCGLAILKNRSSWSQRYIICEWYNFLRFKRLMDKISALWAVLLSISAVISKDIKRD